MSWSMSINKRSKLFLTRSENQRKHCSFRFTRNSSNLLNNEVSHRTALKSLSQEQLHKISLELHWSFYLRSKLSVSLLQWHYQCDDLLITLFINESICLSVHMQLVSLLQWHLFSMQWSTRFHRFTHQWIWSYIHMQLVSLLQWRAQSQSLQWATQLVSLLQWHC